jgi:quercetin dioxygenase-like cupin family protein
MASYTLALYQDRLGPATSVAVPGLPRVVYVIDGDAEVSAGAASTKVHGGAAWHGSAACAIVAGARGARVLRFELRAGSPAAGGSDILLDRPIALDPAQPYLMRCDRVDFAPGGEALPHGHRGGGIRWLLEGELEVRAGGHPGRLMKPGDAWFEDGIEPVHAIASREVPTSFIRVSILPREIQGKSSIVYVDPAHASVKPRRYTVYVDHPIDLPAGGPLRLPPDVPDARRSHP